MKSSSAVSLGRKDSCEGEFKSFRKGEDGEMKGRLPQPRTWRKEGRQSLAMYTWMVVSGLGRKKDSSLQISSLGTEHIGGSR